MHYYHFQIPDRFKNGNWSYLFIAWIRESCTSEQIGEAAFEAKMLLDRLCQQMSELKVINRRIYEVMHSPEYVTQYNLLLSVPGIGAGTAALLLLELGDLSEFKSIEKFCAYIGLVPDCRCSGDDHSSTFITKRQHSDLRKKFIECAWRAISSDPTMAMSFAKWRRNMPKNKAIIKVAAKLARCVKSVLKNQKRYEEYPLN
ncbi:MAG: transposase [Bacillus sp. (in: firmicutes)]